LADLRRESVYLQDRDESGWIDKLVADDDALETLLAAYPQSGRKLAERGSVVLRKLRLRQTPYYVWYSFDQAEPGSVLTLVRLFHTRQQTSQPRL
jgi:hypothetical protein